MGLSVPQLLIILAIVLLLFGAKRLRSIGTDLGAAIKGFKGAVREEAEESKETTAKLDTEDAPVAESSKTNSNSHNKV